MQLNCVTADKAKHKVTWYRPCTCRCRWSNWWDYYQSSVQLRANKLDSPQPCEHFSLVVPIWWALPNWKQPTLPNWAADLASDPDSIGNNRLWFWCAATQMIVNYNNSTRNKFVMWVQRTCNTQTPYFCEFSGSPRHQFRQYRGTSPFAQQDRWSEPSAAHFISLSKSTKHSGRLLTASMSI